MNQFKKASAYGGQGGLWYLWVMLFRNTKNLPEWKTSTNIKKRNCEESAWDTSAISPGQGKISKQLSLLLRSISRFSFRVFWCVTSRVVLLLLLVRRRSRIIATTCPISQSLFPRLAGIELLINKYSSDPLPQSRISGCMKNPWFRNGFSLYI